MTEARQDLAKAEKAFEAWCMGWNRFGKGEWEGEAMERPMEKHGKIIRKLRSFPGSDQELRAPGGPKCD